MSLIGTRSIKLNESGQGVIEYILVLTTTVFLIGTFLYQFSTAFKKYANNFFGEYVACLMETGELPGQAKGECKDAMNPFTLADGRTSTGKDISGTGGIGSGSSGGSGSGSGSGSGKGSKGSTGGKKSGSGSSDSGGSSGSSGGAPAGELGTNSTSGDGSDGFGSRSKRTTTSVKGSGEGAAGAGGRKNSALKPVGAYSSNGSGNSGSDGRGKKRVLDRGFGFSGQDEQERRADERPASRPVAKDDGEGLRPKKVSVNTSRGPAAAKDTGESGYSIGNVIRILIIAGILVAIFILFGSQLLAISKGGEK